MHARTHAWSLTVRAGRTHAWSPADNSGAHACVQGVPVAARSATGVLQYRVGRGGPGGSARSADSADSAASSAARRRVGISSVATPARATTAAPVTSAGFRPSTKVCAVW